jgi:hypothetical protein
MTDEKGLTNLWAYCKLPRNSFINKENSAS